MMHKIVRMLIGRPKLQKQLQSKTKNTLKEDWWKCVTLNLPAEDALDPGRWLGSWNRSRGTVETAGSNSWVNEHLRVLIHCVSSNNCKDKTSRQLGRNIGKYWRGHGAESRGQTSSGLFVITSTNGSNLKESVSFWLKSEENLYNTLNVPISLHLAPRIWIWFPLSSGEKRGIFLCYGELIDSDT